MDLIPVDLAELISDVANLMQHKANEKGLSLGFDYIFPVPRRIITDPIRLKQILINLVGNAVKFTTLGGVKINLSFIKEEERIEFAIIDTGSGLTPEQSSRLFKAFSQADTTITRKFGGTGLGLVISAQLAQKLGGHITLESSPGRGSVFTLSIKTGSISEEDLSTTPLFLNVSAPQVKTVETVPQLAGRVLVAEDGEDNRGLISLLLKKTGVDFKIVENGLLALEEAAKNTFDLILMDIQMPVMDGYTAMKIIRERGSIVPIIALTANAMKADIDKAFTTGCTDFLGKPFTRTELFSKLKTYIQCGTSCNADVPELCDEPVFMFVKKDPEMLELVLSIIDKLPLRLEQIKIAAKTADWETTAMLAHSLRGAAGSMGLQAIANIAEAVESAAKDREKQQVIRQFRIFDTLVVHAQQIGVKLKSLELNPKS